MHDDKYVYILYVMCELFLDNTDFKVTTGSIYYNNVEIRLIDKEDDYFLISFQKENGSFTLTTDKSLSSVKREQIKNIIQKYTNSILFASYSFVDLDVNINHFVYNDNMLEFNSNLLKELNDTSQIENLNIKFKNKKLEKTIY